MPRNSPGPSAKDKKMYESLRDEGASKGKKAARISNARRGELTVEGRAQGWPRQGLRRP